MQIAKMKYGSRSHQGGGFLAISRRAATFSLLAALSLPILLTGCKPTERNYQAAYDMAIEKRDARDPDADLLYGGHELQSPLGAIREKVGEIPVMALRIPLTRIEGDSAATAGRYRVAVALYSMKENARAHAADLRARFLSDRLDNANGTKKKNTSDPGIGVFRQGDEKYFVTAASLPTLQEAVLFLDSLRRAAPETRYIGLRQTEPLLLISPR